MRKYLYYGTSTLAFTHEGEDYLVLGKGPHELPEAATQVESACGLSLLVEEKPSTVINNQKIK